MTKQILKTWVAGVIVFLMLAGCQAMTGKTAGQNVDDAAMTSRVKTALTMDKAVNLTRIDVDTSNGVVSLNGIVDTPEQKARAEDIVQRVSGVRGINNNLQVSGRATR
jgi:hyperosmotically inducible periplasmic protein